MDVFTKLVTVLLAVCTGLMVGMAYAQLMDQPQPVAEGDMVRGRQTPPTYICEEQCQKPTGEWCFQSITCGPGVTTCGEERTDPQSRMKCVESPSNMTNCKNEQLPDYCYMFRQCICREYTDEGWVCKATGTKTPAEKKNYSKNCGGS